MLKEGLSILKYEKSYYTLTTEFNQIFKVRRDHFNKGSYRVPINIIEGEIWKQIYDFEDYQISNLGRVKFKEFPVNHSYNEDGYRRFVIYDKDFRVARVMCETFIRKFENNEQVDHINMIRDDDRLENLRIVDSSTNQVNKKHRKIYEIKDIILNKTYITDNIRKFSRELNYNRGTVRNAINNKSNIFNIKVIEDDNYRDLCNFIIEI